MEGIEPELLPCPLCQAEGDTLLRGVCYPNGSVDKEGAVMCPACGCRATLKAWQSRPRSYPESEQDQIKEAMKLVSIGAGEDGYRSYPGTGGIWGTRNQKFADATFTDRQWAHAAALILNAAVKGKLVAASARSAQAVKEPTASELVAWFKSRPGISWEATVRDIERAVVSLSSTNCGGTE